MDDFTSTNSANTPDAIGGVLSRVNQLGAVTEKLFSRLYNGLHRRKSAEAEQEARERRQAAFVQKMRAASMVSSENKLLHTMVRDKDREIAQLRGILSALDEGIVMQDTEGRVVYINDAARALLGSQKNIWESELGTLFNAYRDVTHPGSELVPLGEPTRVQVNHRIVGAQLAAVGSEMGERLGTMIVLRDVTRDALADRLKDQFVTAISHELKTPMTVIKGMSEVLASQFGQTDEAGSPNLRFLETLTRNVDILDRMVIELLDISEMGAGTFAVRQHNILLEPLVWSVINGLAPEIKKNRLEVFVMLRDQPSLIVTGDEQRLRWALGHLVQNAVRYTEPGGQIFLQLGVDEDNPRFLTVDVMDTGVGISEKDLPHIFERFYRGEPRTPSGKLLDPRGLGQGLFVARTIADAHGGYLRVQSQQGVGSAFTLALPAI